VKTKVSTVLVLAVVALAAIIAVIYPRSQAPSPELQADPQLSFSPPAPPRSEAIPATPPRVEPVLSVAREATITAPPAEKPAATNKLERLDQIRGTFRALATGDPTNALRAAKQITDETERETALLTLVTEWKHGELGPPRQRAGSIANFGLEAGLGIELAGNPELAVAWANELTEGAGRRAVLRETAIRMVSSDPSAAFALSEQLPLEERRNFIGSLFAGWGAVDTDAAFKWAGQMPDPVARDEAVQAIRTTAPVGIGTALGMVDGYPVINELIPGAPAALSGQIHPGDRIVALAQGDNSFIDAHNLPLEKIVEMIRGAPNTVLQIQVLAADAPQSSAPRTVAILRDQIKFKK
jgi:hypothetical protein